MRVLILGKNGLLGHDLEKTFHHHDFISLGSKELDITQKERVFETFMTIQPDVVINATGYTNVDLAEQGQEEEKANQVNGYAVGILAQAAREIDATFVYFSTDYVFDGQKKAGYKENDAPAPLNAYGRSKLLGERLLSDEMELQRYQHDPEGKYFLIRTSWLFGEHGKNFVATMLRIAKEKLASGKKNPEIKVVNDQYGKPTYALDLARQVQWLIESHEYPSGIYHITNEEQTTWFDFAQEIFRLAKLPVSVVPCTSSELNRPAVRPKYSALENTKLPALRPWKEALQAYLHEIQVI